jgi:hypothetical protein
MRYSYEFKRKCVEMYYRGEYPDTPDGIGSKRFHKTILEWVRIEESCGPEALKHKNQNKEWTTEERYDLVARVLAGESNKSVALEGLRDQLEGVKGKLNGVKDADIFRFFLPDFLW